MPEPTLVECASACTITVVHQWALNPPDFVSLGVTPESILKAMGFGLAFVLSMWAIGWVVGVFSGLIRKL